MPHPIRTLFAALALSGLVSACLPVAHAEGPDGKQLLADKKCTRCHSGPGVKGGKHSLAGVGKAHTDKWLTAYLQKEEAKDGKKHRVKFKGTPAELAEVVRFLKTLK